MPIHMKPSQSDEWFTPPAIFEALGLTFDLDPAGSPLDHVPAMLQFTKDDDGLAQPWFGLVWMNPPFGGRNGQVPWLEKFFEHGDGIALVNALTSSAWFHEQATRAETFVFPKGKTKFLRPDGTVGGSPGNGIVLLGAGLRANAALASCGLGWFVNNRRNVESAMVKAQLKAIEKAGPARTPFMGIMQST